MSSDYSLILEKIQQFIHKYYINEVIKGFLIFFAVAFLYLLSILLLENFLWLSTTVRTILFWTFIAVSVYLFIRFIGISLAKLIKLGKQISPIEASKIIGNHFPEVDDQLINLLQLKSSDINSDLLEASITQKSKQLSPIPFTSAINFKKSLSYAKYALVPIFLFLMFSAFKGFDWYKKSLDRVVNYNVAYEPPAPFYFKILNSDLSALQNSDYVLQVSTQGKIIPNQIQIAYNGANYFLNKSGNNTYSYTFSSLSKPIIFNLFSGDVSSKEYKISVNDAPSILDFYLKIIPPAHTLQKGRKIENSGAAIVPEGSRLQWNARSIHATNINFIYNDSTYSFLKNKEKFIFNKTVAQTLAYQITSSNKYVDKYEKLDFNIDVIKDQVPFINVLAKNDTINKENKFYYGRVSDDYGISKLQIVYYLSSTPKEKQSRPLAIAKNSSGEFTFQFPNDLDLEEAKEYAFYFEVFDNDSYNGAKSSKSETFNYTALTGIEKKQIESESQQQQLNDFENTIEKFQESEIDLESFSKFQKQSLSVSFKDKEKLSTLLEKQFKQQKKLKELSENLKKTLDKLEDNEDKKLTKEELERAKKDLEKNKKLIDEIKKAIEKLSPEELKDKVDKLNKENKKTTKNLSQILELTKRHYVIEKHQRIVQMLELLSEKQIKASEDEADLNHQEQINKEFQIIRKELDDLREHNAGLRKPMVLDDDSVYEGKIQKKQNEATEDIKDSNTIKAKRKQNVAGVMMKNLAAKMSETSAAGAAEQLKDDKESLRQILDNLVLFSINQEDNMKLFSESSVNNPNYSKHIRTQNKLREHFKHIDDSLYAVSSRNPKISTKINNLISNIDYNLGSSLESITDNRTYQGVTKLRFAIANSNDLAVMLSQSLKQLNERQKPGSSKKKGEGFQLPDIIKKQESLNKAFEKALNAGQKKPGDSKKQGEGGQKKEGNSGKEGEKGNQGQQGQEGQSGESGQKGQSGQQGKSGESGQKGQSGKSGQNGQSGENGSNGSFGLGKGKNGQGEGKSQGDGEGGEGKNQSDSNSGKFGKGKKGNSSSQKGKGNGKEGKTGGDENSKERSGNEKGTGKKGNSAKGKGKSEGNKSGGNGSGEGEEGESEENDYEQLFEIYKQQQDLRNSLKNRLEKEGITRIQKRVLDQMKQVEDELIENGFSTQTLNRMLNLKHQLFKLDEAQFQQGKDKKRKSKTNTKSYISNQAITPEAIKKYFNTTEILNRDALPLKANFKEKVNNYFAK